MSLQFPEYEGLEGSDASVMVCTELLDGILERGVSVDLSTSDITAIAGKTNSSLSSQCVYLQRDRPITTSFRFYGVVNISINILKLM